jgi:nitroimidazol reductase NimA-like FMN-containing flavoprotein (pyridoxamine 5'-phosphate oxidase superfamily)
MSEQPPRGRAEPTLSRPQMPEGYGVPKDSAGMLPWNDIREVLQTAQIYWVATTRPDGRPHVVPIWGAWVDDTFYFEGSPETRRGRNLAANPAVAVHIERGNLAIMVEGVTEIVSLDEARFAEVADSFASRYSYRPESREGWYTVRPRVALAWDEFPKSTTRYRFDQD